MTDRLRWWSRHALVVAVLLAAVGCSADDAEPDQPDSSPAATPSAAPEPPATPERGACYRLRFRAAVAPTSEASPRDCAQAHTSETYAVGQLETVVDGHLLAVDSTAVQEQVATACPAGLGEFLGGTEDDLRLSMIRPVWFTPSVESSDQGANWYRCDAVVVNGSSSLIATTGSLRGILDREADRETVAMCGTAAPDDKGFTRVPCSEEHSWKAISVVAFPDGDYPGEAAARDRGAAPCEDAANQQAEDPLDFEWGYEWPTEAQWQAGQTFGRCWAPTN
ncbi:hypothetical protein FXB39_08570 [Nocardioides sp. BGMRC 2183]|nr:hypothetical protein FXB39_08570 [Nocardioides sp. BGMRC 2183]